MVLYAIGFLSCREVANNIQPLHLKKCQCIYSMGINI